MRRIVEIMENMVTVVSIIVLTLALSAATMCMGIGLAYTCSGNWGILLPQHYLGIFGVSVGAIVLIALLERAVFGWWDDFQDHFEMAVDVGGIIVIIVLIAVLIVGAILNYSEAGAADWLIQVTVCYAAIFLLVMPRLADAVIQ